MSDQSTPVFPGENTVAGPTPPSQSGRLLFFPLTRKASIRPQILGLFLYSLFMALNISANQILAYLNVSYVNGFYVKNPTHAIDWGFPLAVWLLMLTVPASTVLCGALFGSWRGALTSFFSIGGGLLLTHGFNHIFSGLQDYLNASYIDFQPFLIPGILAALVVGLIYDFRHDENWGKSILTLLLGSTIVYFGFALLLTLMNPTGTWGPLALCLFLFLIPCTAFLMVGTEWILQQIIALWRQKQHTGKEVELSDESPRP